MVYRDLAYWLQGFFEMENPTSLNEEQTAMIKEHLALCFKVETGKSKIKFDPIQNFGSCGISGFNGTCGTSGISGTSGRSGTSGTGGYDGSTQSNVNKAAVTNRVFTSNDILNTLIALSQNNH